MVVLRIFTLLLALGFSAPAFAYIIDGDGDIVAAYRSVGIGGDNNNTDYTQFQCARDGTGSPLTDFGCVDGAGGLCSAVTDAICDVQRVPAGRCAAGNSGVCIFPLGAGFCVASGATTYDDNKVGCLPDAAGDHGATTGTFAAAVCAAGSGSCDMSTNVPSCACQGENPVFPAWEGSICGSNPQARCSDGDPLKDVGGFAGGLCTSIDTSIGGNTATGGRCGDSNRFPGLAASSTYGIENVPRIGTPQRKPGTSLSAPTTAVRDVKVTMHWKLENYDDAANPFFDFKIRKVKQLGNTYYQDAGWGSAQTNAAQLDNTITVWACDPPRAWAANTPVDGQCTAATTTMCITDGDCGIGDTCDLTTVSYCFEDARDVDGLIFTRDISDAELAAATLTGICPPDCNVDSDLNTFQQRALIEVGDPAIGPRAGKGDIIFVFPLTSQTWLDPDNRCYIGGDPDVVDALCTGGTCGTTSVACTGGGVGTCPLNIGRCDDSSAACDPSASGTCGGTADCKTCGGTWNGTYGNNPGGYSDSVNGNSTALYPGYHNPTGILPMHTAGDVDKTRVGVTGDHPSTVRVPFYSISTSGKASSEFRDNTCDPAGRDHCALGEVVSGGGTGIGAGGTFTLGAPVTYDPEGPGYTATSSFAANDPGVETSGANTFLRLYDRASGPDGVPGCLGDNEPIGGLDVPCDLQLGQAGVVGSTGSDDVPLVGDFSLAQDGSDIHVAIFARFKMIDPTRKTPIFNAVAAAALNDESLVFPSNLDFINKNNATYCPLDPNGDEQCDRSAESFCSEYGGSTDGQVCDGLVADTDGDGIPDSTDICVLVPNPGQVASVQDGLVGIGCSCLCGDTNNSCTVSGIDAQSIQVQILPNLGAQAGCYQIGSPDDQGVCGVSPQQEVRGCDVNNSSTCSGLDAQVVQGALPSLVGTPSFPLANGYSPTNCAQNTQDTCGPDGAACP